MALDPAVAAESAMKQDNRAGVLGSGRRKANVVGVHGATVEQDLVAVRGKLRRLGRPFMESFPIHRYTLERYSPAAYADAIHRFVNHQIAGPAILSVRS